MTRVKIAELKDRLSFYLRAVEAGGEVEVTDRNRPIARILPIRETTVASVMSAPVRPFAAIRDRVYPPANWAVGSTELLLEERQDR
jgi:prevent-host-death family protein